MHLWRRSLQASLSFQLFPFQPFTFSMILANLRDSLSIAVTMIALTTSLRAEHTAVLKAARLINTTDAAVEFDYQFEDDNWRREHIDPHSSVYIYDEQPRHPLTVTVGQQHFALGTYDVLGRLDARRNEYVPDIKRFDEAAPYFFEYSNGAGLSLYAGFPTSWSTDVAAKSFERLKRANINAEVFTSPVDDKKPDLLVRYFEFQAACDIVGDEYKKRMATSSVPELQIHWSRPKNAQNQPLAPVIGVCGCDTPAGQKFLKDSLETLLRKKLNWQDYTMSYVCCAVSTVMAANLNPEFAPNGRPSMDRILAAVSNSLNKGGNFVFDHEHKINPLHRRICTSWKYFSAANGSYRWKLIIDIEIANSDSNEHTVKFVSNLVGYKLVPGTDQWNQLTQFAIYRLGEHIQHTMVRPASQPTEEIETMGIGDSFPVKVALDTSTGLAQLITGRLSSE